ncbi:MAG: hypothetical protein AMXMBFR36_15410 [Acidobacteriota bacterium]
MSHSRSAWHCSLLVALAAAPASADNLVPEGHFDLPADVTVFLPDGADALIAWNGALDADDCGVASGAANVTSNSTSFGDTVNFRVCIEPVAPNTLYRFGGAAYFTPQPQTAEIWYELRFQIQAGCGEGHVDNHISPTAPASTTFAWQRVSTTAMSPPDAVGAMLSISLFKQTSSGSVFGTADAVFLRPAAEIFFEGFETGSSCRWSASST